MAEQNYLERWKERKAIAEKKRQQPQTFGETLISWVKTFFGALLIVMIINGVAVASFVVPTGSMENTVMAGDFLFVNKFIFGPSTPQIVPFINMPLPFFKAPGLRDPQQGDVIVFIYPGNKNEVEASRFEYYLKRCVAAAGDELKIVNKRVYVNGKEYAVPEHANVDMNRIAMEGSYSQMFPEGAPYTPDNYGPIRVPKKGDKIALSAENYEQWAMFIRREGHQVGTDGTNILVDGKLTGTYIVERDYCFGMGDNRDNSADSRFWGFIPYDNVVGKPIMVYWSWPVREPGVEDYSIIEKLGMVRWGRIGNLID
ncbi:MAG TPA: signal peptidase I [Patescibacteria group bacterium]|nr:signal peptidase I [Patescibacteria group bacterium]